MEADHRATAQFVTSTDIRILMSLLKAKKRRMSGVIGLGHITFCQFETRICRINKLFSDISCYLPLALALLSSCGLLSSLEIRN
jgi:hypothetical protein